MPSRTDAPLDPAERRPDAGSDSESFDRNPDRPEGAARPGSGVRRARLCG